VTKPNYGIDAPGLVRGFFIGGLNCALLSFAIYYFLGFGALWFALVLMVLALISIYLLGMGSLMVFYSKITKISDRDTVLNQIPWRGDERVLDVGCGRGLMLVGAAKRLTTGSAVGVDIWSAKDQSDNLPAAANANAVIEGVADRVELATADARELPYDNRSFDVVMSHWVIHNIEKPEERQRALLEMVRVLKPGGHLLLSDIEHRESYMKLLTEFGLSNLRLLVDPNKDRFLRMVSFGSFGPSAIIAQKSQ